MARFSVSANLDLPAMDSAAKEVGLGINGAQHSLYFRGVFKKQTKQKHMKSELSASSQSPYLNFCRMVACQFHRMQ